MISTRVENVKGLYKGFLVCGPVAILLAVYYEKEPLAAIGQSAAKDVLPDAWISMKKPLPKHDFHASVYSATA